MPETHISPRLLERRFLPDYTPIQRLAQATRRAHPGHAQEARRADVGSDPGWCDVGALPRVDNATVNALARAFRWWTMLDTGVHAKLRTWPGLLESNTL